MKFHILIVLILGFCIIAPTLGFSQERTGKIDVSITKLQPAKKRQIAQLLTNIYVATEIYANSTDNDEVARVSVDAIQKIRKFSLTLPNGFFKQTIISGAGAWEKAFLFRYEKLTGQQIPPARRREIIEVYKLRDIPPDDRADRLFEFAQTFFNMAADTAVDSGVKTKN